jgi:hypothetical protein
VRKGWFALAAVVVVLSRASVAGAHPGYPSIVNSTFNIDVTKFEPPMGCQLCHTDPGGGSPLRAFGQRLVSTYDLDSNASTENDNSLTIALKGMQSGDPLLVQDLQKGTDPNPDVTNDPLPQYGCSAVRGARDNGGAASLGAALLVLSLPLVRRNRQRP